MMTLYHFELCPFSRQIRIALAEKNLEFTLVSEKYWLRQESFISLNPASRTPVLKDGKITLIEFLPILAYLDEEYNDVKLIDGTAQAKAEIRRMIMWFNYKFATEVSLKLIEEKVISFYSKNSSPRSEQIRQAKTALYSHLDYIAQLLDKRGWLCTATLSMADIVAASHISILDFLNDMPWSQYKIVAEWYSLIKSRPSFRPLLDDYVQGFTPPEHYMNLDF